MTQAVFNDIDPNVKSGTELATDLNNFKASLLTQHSGASAPTYAEIGTEWLDSSVTDLLIKKVYDGTQWVTVFTLDTAAHKISYGGNNPIASFTITRTDDAADMFEMFRDINTDATGGLIYTQLNDADVKKTFGKIKINSDTNVNAVEDASVSFETMLSGTLTETFRLDKTKMFAKFLEGIGERVLVTNALGNVSTKVLDQGGNLFQDSSADNGDTNNFTATTLTFSKSLTPAELIEGEQVYKAVSTGAGETLETANINLNNAHINHPMIVKLKYKCSTDWSIDILDQLDNTLASESLRAFTPLENEANTKSMFALIPSGTTSLNILFTSTAADVLLFDDIEVVSLITEDQSLYFDREVANLQTNTDLFNIATLKNKAYKVEAKITRETDTNYAEAIVEFFMSYDENGATWRIAKETVNDLESVDTNISFNMSSGTLQYSSDDLTGANYTGKINGKITRLL